MPRRRSSAFRPCSSSTGSPGCGRSSDCSRRKTTTRRSSTTCSPGCSGGRPTSRTRSASLTSGRLVRRRRDADPEFEAWHRRLEARRARQPQSAAEAEAPDAAAQPGVHPAQSPGGGGARWPRPAQDDFSVMERLLDVLATPYDHERDLPIVQRARLGRPALPHVLRHVDCGRPVRGLTLASRSDPLARAGSLTPGGPPDTVPEWRWPPTQLAAGAISAVDLSECRSSAGRRLARAGRFEPRSGRTPSKAPFA